MPPLWENDADKQIRDKKLKDLVAVAQAFNQKKTKKRQKEKKTSSFSRPEYQSIAEAPTMADIVNVINNNPKMCNRLAAQALMDNGDNRITKTGIEQHAEMLKISGARFDVKRAMRLVLMALKEGTRLN